MTATFQALSALLCYPTPELVAAADEIEATIVAEALVDADALRPLITTLRGRDLYEPQARYVELFDRTRRLSLNLYEHVHGESRDRGQAMVDLAALYERHGLVPAVRELPDYLPLFLEFLSTLPLIEAKALLADTAHILASLEERLLQQQTPYVAVLTALRQLSGESAPVAAEKETAPDDLAALDDQWEETAVTFGPGNSLSSCPAERLETRLRAAGRDVRLATA
jgi:nitrate reductase molybdenum cofactor assembly chaperone NarJ/NarW